MLRLEARIPFYSAASNAYFNRTINYLMSPGGDLTDRLRANLALQGILLQSTDTANPFIQVFKITNTSTNPLVQFGGLFVNPGNNWVIQFTGWIDSTTPLPQGQIQNGWTTAIVNSLRDVGLQMSDAEIRAAMNANASWPLPGGFSKYAPERLRTASGAPNFAPLGAPDSATSWLNNADARLNFVQPNTNTNQGNGPYPQPNTNTNTNTNQGNGPYPQPGQTQPGQTQPGQFQQPQKTSPLVPLLIVAGLAGGIWYVTKGQNEE